MIILKPDGLSINRRGFLGASVAGLLFSPTGQSMYVPPGACRIQDIKNSDSAIAIDPLKIHIWIDGHWKAGMNNIAVMTTFPQTEESYVNKVVLASGEKTSIGVRYFRPGQKMKSGTVPYILFNNVDLRYSQKYFIVISLKEGDTFKVYRYTLDKSLLVPSRLNGSHLPETLQTAFEKSHKGKVFTTFHFPVGLIRKEYCKTLAMTGQEKGCYLKHFPKAGIRYIKSGGQFSVDVHIEVPDVSSEHFMRYVLMTDPVGRMLSIASRNYGDYKKLTLNLSNHTDAYWKQNWGLEPDQVAWLPDCPYVMIFTENVKDGLFVSAIWLR